MGDQPVPLFSKEMVKQMVLLLTHTVTNQLVLLFSNHLVLLFTYTMTNLLVLLFSQTIETVGSFVLGPAVPKPVVYSLLISSPINSPGCMNVCCRHVSMYT